MTPQQRIAAAKAREDQMAEAGRRLQAVLSSPGARQNKGSAQQLGTIEIDDDVPLTRQFAGRDKFPFRRLEVGQSFFVPAGPERKTFSSVHRFNEILAPKKFTCRKWVQPDGAKGFRVWRVE